MDRLKFSPAWFLPGPHAQTIWGRLVRRRRLVPLRRERIETPDGDELILDHLDAPSSNAPAHFILLHGLEGSAHSVYMQGLLDAIRKRGASATAMNFRSCARDLDTMFGTIPNRTARFYHSGEITDFDFVLRTLAARMPHRPFVVIGASLGGNALLKWLAAHPAQTFVKAAATISVPYDLRAGGEHLETGIGRFYVSRFLRTLVKKVERVVLEFPETRSFLDVERVRRASTFREFDDAATAPLHGFADADDYYRRASSIFDLGRITTPTLCISAKDDPFTPPGVLDRVRAAAPPSMTLLVTESGGHTGFVSGPVPWRCVYWAEEYAVHWLLSR
jgi:predicted alpha/beta-fold hydrolase